MLRTPMSSYLLRACARETSLRVGADRYCIQYPLAPRSKVLKKVNKEMKPRIDSPGSLTVVLVKHLATSGGEPVMSCCPDE
jgi:hypothetical protein